MKKIIFFASLQSLKKEVGSGVGSGSGFISQRYGSADLDPHQNVTDPQHTAGENFKSVYGPHILSSTPNGLGLAEK